MDVGRLNDNVGRFDFMINEFADPVSRLTVHKTVANDLSGYFASGTVTVNGTVSAFFTVSLTGT